LFNIWQIDHFLIILEGRKEGIFEEFRLFLNFFITSIESFLPTPNSDNIYLCRNKTI